MDDNRKRYILWVTYEDGSKHELAQAYGSPFWTEMYHLAQAQYGAEKVSYTYGEPVEDTEAEVISPLSVQARL